MVLLPFVRWNFYVFFPSKVRLLLIVLLVVQCDKNEIHRRTPEEVVSVRGSAIVSPETRWSGVGRVEKGSDVVRKFPRRMCNRQMCNRQKMGRQEKNIFVASQWLFTSHGYWVEIGSDHIEFIRLLQLRIRSNELV